MRMARILESIINFIAAVNDLFKGDDRVELDQSYNPQGVWAA